MSGFPRDIDRIVWNSINIDRDIIHSHLSATHLIIIHKNTSEGTEQTVLQELRLRSLKSLSNIFFVLITCGKSIDNDVSRHSFFYPPKEQEGPIYISGYRWKTEIDVIVQVLLEKKDQYDCLLHCRNEEAEQVWYPIIFYRLGCSPD